MIQIKALVGESEFCGLVKGCCVMKLNRVDRFQDRFLKYVLLLVSDNKYFIKGNFAVWGHHLNQ